MWCSVLCFITHFWKISENVTFILLFYLFVSFFPRDYSLTVDQSLLFITSLGFYKYPVTSTNCQMRYMQTNKGYLCTTFHREEQSQSASQKNKIYGKGQHIPAMVRTTPEGNGQPLSSWHMLSLTFYHCWYVVFSGVFLLFHTAAGM